MSSAEMQPLHSANLKAVGYDPKTYILTIAFVNGRVYEYDNVEGFVYEALLHADSAGKTFFTLVRGKYEARDMTPDA